MNLIDRVLSRLFSLTVFSHLISEVNQLESSWPPQLQYSRIHNAADGVSILSPNYEYHVTRAHIDVLRCRFLLERLKFSRFQCSTQNLMDLSQESLSLVLRFWLKRDQWSQYSGSFDWLVSSTRFSFHTAF